MNGEQSITGRGQSAKHMMAVSAMELREHNANVLWNMITHTEREIRVHSVLHTLWAVLALASSTLFLVIEPLPVFIIMACFLILRHFSSEALTGKLEANRHMQATLNGQIEGYNEISEWIEAVSSQN